MERREQCTTALLLLVCMCSACSKLAVSRLKWSNPHDSSLQGQCLHKTYLLMSALPMQQSVIRSAVAAGSPAESEPANMAVTSVGGRRLKGLSLAA